MKSINFKSLGENDLPLLHHWFQRPHVKQWYARDENYTLDMIREKYLPIDLQKSLLVKSTKSLF
jgi:aminoglycoside 6'-N-acetyltransferase